MIEIEFCLAYKLNEHIVGELAGVVDRDVVPLSGNKAVHRLCIAILVVAENLGLSSREGIEGYINLAVVTGDFSTTCSAAVEACSFDVNNLVTAGNLYFLYTCVERIGSSATYTPAWIAFVDALAVLGTVDCNNAVSKVGGFSRILSRSRDIDNFDGSRYGNTVVGSSDGDVTYSSGCEQIAIERTAAHPISHSVGKGQTKLVFWAQGECCLLVKLHC